MVESDEGLLEELLERAEFMMEAGQGGEAEALLRRALALSPGNGYILGLLSSTGDTTSAASQVSPSPAMAFSDPSGEIVEETSRDATPLWLREIPSTDDEYSEEEKAQATSPWDLVVTLTPPVDLDADDGGRALLFDHLDGAQPMGELWRRPASREGEPLTSREGAAVTEPPPSVNVVDALMGGARDRFDLGDFSGSLALVEQVLAKEPDHAEARRYEQRNKATLLLMYQSKLGDLSRRPKLLTSPEEVIWMNMHHQAGFLVSQVDGDLSFEDLIDVSGLSRFDALRIMAELVQKGVIG